MVDMVSGMRAQFRRLGPLTGMALILLAGACAPTPAVEPGELETAVAQAAFDLLTQTAAAASPTPPPPTLTPTPMATDTPVVTPTEAEPPPWPKTVTFAACWLGGPGNTWPLEVNVPEGKDVEVIGMGSVPGWIILRDYKFQRPCWILESDLSIDPRTDLASLPVMTPGIPLE